MATSQFTFRSALMLVMLLQVTAVALYDLTKEAELASPAPLAACFGPSLPRADEAFPLAVAPPVKPRVWQTVVALVTAYTPGVESCGDSADGRTSTNRSTDVYPYGIAADGAVLPPGSLVKVPEYMDVSFPDRAWEVDDTGGDMRRDFRRHFIVHLDLRYRTVVSANKVGRQWMEVDVDVTSWSADARERLREASTNGWRMRGEGKLP
jgi:3D (Asp-Asp-Asp) domain-containing protein